MLTLRARLQAEPRAFWRLVAEAWGLPPATGLDDLVAALLDADRVYALWQSLPGEAQAALAALHRHGGRMLWALFVRRYGPLRDLSPAQWAVEAPHLHPQSPAEWLWYRALVGRAFFETSQGLLEHAYIPGDLALLLPLAGGPVEEEIWGQPAVPEAYAHPRPAAPLTTLQVWTRALAWARAGHPWRTVPLPEPWAVAPGWLQSLFQALGLADASGRLRGQAVGTWLTAPATEAWWAVFRAWRDAPQVNDLRALPHLRFEGPWENDPVAARARLLAWLAALPRDEWLDLDAFVAAVREHEPHFQRPAPQDFDSWYIRRASDGAYLRGLEAWEEVDGALVRFWLTGPAHWLGLVDLGHAVPDGPPTAFRLTPWAADLLADRSPPVNALPLEDARARWLGRGRLLVPWRTPRAQHYHIARFTTPEDASEEGLHYRLTAAGLRAARAQRLRGRQVARWLAAHVDAWPESATQAVARVFHGDAPARLQKVWVLRLPSRQALAALQRSPAVAYFVDQLGPTAVAVRAESLDALLDALWDLGLLVESDFSPREV